MKPNVSERKAKERRLKQAAGKIVSQNHLDFMLSKVTDDTDRKQLFDLMAPYLRFVPEYHEGPFVPAVSNRILEGQERSIRIRGVA